ncbi:MAG TPA: M20/M25/M40 family metallo-hydrolase [Bacillota bacterium]
MRLDVVELLQSLIAIPSLSGEEGRIAAFLREKLEKFCDTVHVDEMNNVIAEIKGVRDGPVILFNAHIDHAPVGEMAEPFVGQVVDGASWGTPGQVILGRGACDDKGGVAAMLCAAAEVATRRNFPGKLILTFVAMEEAGGAIGTKKVLNDLLKGQKQRIDLVILGEPTEMGINLGHRGKVEFLLTAIGKSAHASNPSNGVNALLLVNDFINEWQRVSLPTHAILGACTSAVTNLKCPDPGRTAIIPNEATLNFDRRYLPDETPKQVEDQVRQVIARLEEKNGPGRYRLESLYFMPPYYVSPDHPLLKPLRRAMKAQGVPEKTGSWLSGTDGTFIVNDYSIPTIGFGPGSERHCHTAIDHVSIADLKASVGVYRDFILNLGNEVIA